MGNFKILIILFLLFTSCDLNNHIINKNTELKLFPYNGLLLLKVNINGKDAMLLLDSGASKSLIDINSSKDYSFDYKINKNANRYIGLAGEADIYSVYPINIRDFFIGFAGADLTGITGYFKDTNTPIIGIIGSDFLQRTNAIIDYRKSRLILKPKL